MLAIERSNTLVCGQSCCGHLHQNNMERGVPPRPPRVEVAGRAKRPVYFPYCFILAVLMLGLLEQRLSCVKDNSLLMLAITSRLYCFSNKLSNFSFRFSNICHF